MRLTHVLCVTALSGCSFVLDPDDHLTNSDPCDVDGDGFASVMCSGDDCDDDDGTRYPGATPVCDGTVTPRNCWVADLAPTVTTVLGSQGTPDFGYLSRHTDYNSDAPDLSLTSLPPEVHVVAFEDSRLAAVGFVSGDSSGMSRPKVSVFAYDPADPGQGTLLDPALDDIRSFDMGLTGRATAIVVARDKSTTSPVVFRGLDVTAAGGVTRVGLSSTVLGGVDGVNGALTTVRPSAAFFGGFNSADDVVYPAFLSWSERSLGDPFDRWYKIPTGDVTHALGRHVDLAAGPLEQTLLRGAGGRFAFASRAAFGVSWDLTSDSGDVNMPSGTTQNEPSAESTDMAVPVVALLPGTSGTGYAFARWNDEPTPEDSVALAYSDQLIAARLSTVLRIPQLDVEEVALAPATNASAVLAVRGRDTVTNQVGVLLYHVTFGSGITVRSFAREDAMGRPFLVRLEEENGAYWKHIGLTTLVQDADLTVLVAGASSNPVGGGQTVSVAGVRACVR